MTKEELLNKVSFDKDGLVSVIAQDYHNKHVRMQAYMNKEALEKTLATNEVHYYSRSRKKIWLKGEESGNFQYLKGLSIDCDGDAILIQIEQKNNITCHTGNVTCFYQDLEGQDYIMLHEKNELKESNDDIFDKLSKITHDRKINPKEGSYTNYLFDKGIDKVLKKIGEEASETIIAAKNTNKEDVIFEVADLIYHVTVLLEMKDLTWEDIKKELEKR